MRQGVPESGACLQESMWGEGRLLASTSYGAKILLTLGQVYELQADISRGGRPAFCTGSAASNSGRRLTRVS